MVIQHLGENLIFLISQPRAGSTMLQRILGNHPHIHTLSEPWIMLHPLYALRDDGFWFDYDGQVALLARSQFLQSLPNGEDDYYEALRSMYGYLYNQTLKQSGKQFVLDKTPRYYNIIPELYRLFPKAHFIFLLRNPLAVLNSISRTWIKGSWLLLHRYKLDLLKAPLLILKGIEQLNGACTVVHYEQLINDPGSETTRICRSLGLECVEEIIDYGNFEEQDWLHGDKSRINHLRKPDPKNADKWLDYLEDPQAWRLANDYLTILGKKNVSQMGYSFDNLQEKLIDFKPNSIRLWFTLSMGFYINLLDLTKRCAIFEHRVDRVIELLQEAGFKTTVREISSEFNRIKSEKEEKSFIGY